MKLLSVILLLGALHVSAKVRSQERVTLKYESIRVEDALEQIRKNSDYELFFSMHEINTDRLININLKEVEVLDALKYILGDKFSYNVVENIIIIKPKEIVVQQEKAIEVKGKVVDNTGNPLPGVSVVVKGTNSGVSTDVDGNFKLELPEKGMILVFSFIGMKSQEIKIGEQKNLKVVLIEDKKSLEEVVITGYFQRAKESFTGTTVSVKAEELKQFGNNNLIQSLQVFDPSFKIVPNNEFGSDPNKLPNIEIRGQAGFPDISESTLKSNQNMPTFILDGFEVNVEKIFDLDMNRVASVTILKDAAATAIYGSRASNGVVVVETKKPEKGAISLTYNLDATISVADLSDYNLMDAGEKLEAERLAGMYSFGYLHSSYVGVAKQVEYDNKYNDLLLEVRNGVNTHWISQPLEVAVGQKHSLYLEGGDDHFRYGFDVGYNKSNGVMKESGRDRTSVGIKISYRYENIQFKNHLFVSDVKSRNSPYGSFNQYVRLNPYYRLKNANGMYEQYLGGYEIAGRRQFNPIYDAVYLNNKDESSYLNVTNNFSVDWRLTSALKLKGNISISKQFDNSEIYKSPESIEFYGVGEDEEDDKDDFFLRGSYDVRDSKITTVDANAVLSYFKQFDKHVINAVIGGNILETNYYSEGYKAVGFLNDRLSHVGFAKQFKENSSPSGSEALSRLAGVFSNLNYTFNNRLLFDFSARLDGSSKFGKQQRTAPFWSIGTGWNFHNEKFLKENSTINRLKFTANIGTTGGEEFNAYQALTTYKYISNTRYANYSAAEIKALGNEDLKWQTTFNRNIGVETSLFKNLIQLKFNYYNNTTKDLLTDITIAPSIGFSSFKSNMGNVENKGYEANITVVPIKRKDGFVVSLFANMRHNKNIIKKLSQALKDYNERLISNLNDDSKREISTKPHLQFYEGESLYTIYAVPSLGIDPVTGREIFKKKNGTTTYSWDAADQVNCGKSTPDVEGFFGSNVNYKRFSLNLAFNYQFGGQVFNQTLIDRVENADIFNNADKRVLEQRWAHIGDLSYFKGIGLTGRTQASSRFVEDENVLSLTSARISYNLDGAFAKNLKLSKLKISAYMNDVFRLSTVKQERGISYPFARTISFAIQANF